MDTVHVLFFVNQCSSWGQQPLQCTSLWNCRGRRTIETLMGPLNRTIPLTVILLIARKETTQSQGTNMLWLRNIEVHVRLAWIMNGWCTFVLTEACVPRKEPVAKNRSTHAFDKMSLKRILNVESSGSWRILRCYCEVKLEHQKGTDAVAYIFIWTSSASI